MMKSLMTMMGLILCIQAYTQKQKLVPDTTIAIPKVNFDAGGNLIIEASSTSSSHDFDYLVGNWTLHNRKLKSRLTNSHEWIEFDSRVEMHQILGGNGNIDKLIDKSNNKYYEGVALRLFDQQTRLWRIYWADINSGALDPPMVGSFTNNIGHFFCKDTYKGQNVLVVFRWDKRNPNLPIWSQAFSVDNGVTWEWNALNVSERAK